MSSLAVAFVLLIGSAALIYLACEYFVNGVEWVGRKLSVGTQATGTVLAAFGTALPESVVTLVAVAFGTGAGKELGVGAALGGPLALATIAYATVGIVLIVTRQRFPMTAAVRGDFRRLSRDQSWFLILFALKVALGLLLFAGKAWTALIFLAAYTLYVVHEMRADSDLGDEEEIEPLKIQSRAETPATVAALLQTGFALVVIFVASRVFVSQLEVIGPGLGLSPQLVALLLSPIATELPETMNAVIWVRQGKYRLALANISGSMMVQATVPTALGLIFTPWLLGHALLISAGVTAAAILTMMLAFWRGRISRRLLAGMGLFYLAFIAGLLLV